MLCNTYVHCSVVIHRVLLLELLSMRFIAVVEAVSGDGVFLGIDLQCMPQHVCIRGQFCRYPSSHKLMVLKHKHRLSETASRAVSQPHRYELGC